VRIVICDDSRTERDYLRGLLRKAGHEVVGAAQNGEDAIALCDKHRPDLAIMDVAMRGMHGDVAARKIRDAKTAAYIIIVSSNVGFLGKQYADEGFACVNKPHSGAQILCVIDEVVRGEPFARPAGPSR
jgi:CheY-like chemotaxis protein